MSVQPEEAVSQIQNIIAKAATIPEPHTYTDFRAANETLKECVIELAQILSAVIK